MQSTGIFTGVMEIPFIARIRRNHGLEHATLHILSQRHPERTMAGHSDIGGFWILGDVPTAEVQSAVVEGLQRMRSGEHKLAVHPNCGTNFVASGILAGLAAFVAMLGAGRRLRDKLERFPLVATLATLALIVSQPVGLYFQKHVTTSGDPGDLEVVDVLPRPRGQMMAHRVVTRG